jgi:hypothetical protein
VDMFVESLARTYLTFCMMILDYIVVNEWIELQVWTTNLSPWSPKWQW